eukprot:2434262-Rhodomonas_salina.1
MMGVVSSEDLTTLDVDETGSDGRGGFTASLPVTDDVALMAFNDDVMSLSLKSQLCSRGDYHDRIVFIILLLLLVVAALIFGYWLRIVEPDVHVTQ